MPSSGHKDEQTNDLTLFHKNLSTKTKAAFEAQVISAKKLAEIKAAVEQKSIVASLQLEKEKYQESYNEWLKLEREKIDNAVKAAKSAGKSAAEVATIRKKLEEDLARDKARQQDILATRQSDIDKRIREQRILDEKRVADIASRWAAAEYQQSSIYQRKKIQQELRDQAEAHKKDAELQKQANTEALRALAAKKRAAVAGSIEEQAIIEQQNELQAEQVKLKAQIASDTAAADKARQEELDLTRKIISAQASYVKDVMKNPLHLGANDLLNEVEKAVNDAQAELEKLNMEIAVNTAMKADPEVITALKEQRIAIEESVKGFEQTAEALYAAAEEEKENKAHVDAKKQYDKTAAQNVSSMATTLLDNARQARLEKDMNNKAEWKALASPEGMMNKLKDTLSTALNTAVGAALDQITNNINSFYEYQAHVEARLQGSDTSYKKALKEVSNNIGISGVVSQKDVIAKIKEASDAGISYNLELRAFLGTVADSIANTFNAFDASLLRIIRLQQADTTAARLGMEASLTKLFNEYFSDTSYLSDVFDSVSETLLDASSQLARDQSVAFEYMVQKWLGSLYSLGFSQETLQTIAQGVTYLGTGNVQELTANESLNNLMAMAATRVGLDYGAILVDGLDSDTTNKLLKSVVEYLQTIANNTDNNQVVKSAYTDVFGLNMTDLRAIQSLTEGDVQNIYKQSMEYNDMIKETNKQMLLTLTRVPFAQMIDTAFENAMAGASTAIGNNPALYATWKVLNVVEDLTGGIDLPFLNVYGFGVDLNTTVTQLAKLGVGGLGLMGSLLGSLFSGGLFGTFNINQWDWDEYTSRGSATKGITKGSVSDVSESQEMSMNGSASSDDVKQSSMSDGADSAEDDAKVVNKNNKPSDIYQKIYEALADEDTSVLKESIAIHKLLEESRVFKTSMDGMSELLDPKHIFYTQTVVYDAMGKPVFGAAGSTTSSAPGSATGAATDVGQVPTVSGAQQTDDPLVGLITTTNDLLTAIKASEETIATNSGSTNSGIDSIKTKLDSIITSGSDIATKLTTINDSITGLSGTGSSTTASVDLSPLLTTSEELKTLVSSVVSLLTTTNDILDDITVIDNTVGRGIDLDSIVQALTSIDQHGLNLTTLSTTTNDLLTADRVFKTQSVDEGIDLSSVDTSLTSVQDISTTIVALLLATNELLKTDRVFNTSPNLDLGIISTAIDTSTQRITNALGAPVESNGDETMPALQSLYDLASHSTVEANVADILEKLSGETALNVTNVIPPVTRDELTTLIGNTRVFSVDTSATNLELLFTSLLNIRTQLNENSTFTQDVLDATDSLISTIINTPQSSTDTSDIVNNQESNNKTDTTVQENDVTSSTIDNINNLVKSVEEWEYLVAQQEAAAQAAVSVEPSNINIPTSLNASVTTITPEVRKQIEAMFKEAFVAALIGSMNKNSEEETSLTSILQSVFSSMNVRVTNDFFDETLQKIAFTN